jgi:hypothetical protein
MKFKILILLITFSVHKNAISQEPRAEMLLYNIGLGSISSGIGALINKEEHEKWHKVMFKGMAQGALGGYLVYESKNLIGKIEKEQKWEYGWYGKLVNSAGTSIIENAASNRNFWEKWHLNVGFNRIEFYTKNGLKVKYKIMPVSFILTSTALISPEAKFEFKRAIQTGEFIFSNDNPKYPSGATTFGNLFIVSKERLNDHKLFAHEIIHIYQYYDFNFVNTYFNKPRNLWVENSKAFKRVDQILYLDMQYPVLGGLYTIENQNIDSKTDNFFEYEAGYYSRTNDWH